jgi:hypothetical protein
MTKELKYFEVQLFHVTAIFLVYKYSVDGYCSNIVIGLTIQEYKSKLKLQNFEKQNTYFASNAHVVPSVLVNMYYYFADIATKSRWMLY